MPMTPGCQPSFATTSHRRIRGRGCCHPFEDGTRLLGNAGFDVLALGIQQVKLEGEVVCLGGIVGRQQTGAQIGPSDATPGVDA